MPIYKVAGGWSIVNTPGVGKTKEQALRRLRAIKARQEEEKKKKLKKKRRRS
jgi:predicted secreted Zn-dependent protease